MHRSIAALFALATACGPAVTEDQVKQLVLDEFAKANPQGRTGLELVGKAVWYNGPMFDNACLESKDLAFNDDPKARPSSAGGVARIAPTYDNQRYITHSTKRGFCVYMGDDPSIAVKEATWVSTTSTWMVQTEFTMGKATPWFECLSPPTRNRVVEVKVAGDTAKLEGKLDLYQGDCPNPLPGGEERTSASQPKSPAPKPPTKSQVTALAKEFDQALWDQDLEKALTLTSCYNLYEKSKYGTCSAGEFVSLGPQIRGEQRPQDGTPWLEYAVSDFDSFGRIVKDRGYKNLFHVMVKHKRTGRDRSFAVQRVGGSWKMVAVVAAKAEQLTTVRIINDLHKRDRREVFDRRMEGEAIDEHGNPYDPTAEVSDEWRP